MITRHYSFPLPSIDNLFSQPTVSFAGRPSHYSTPLCIEIRIDPVKRRAMRSKGYRLYIDKRRLFYI